MSAPLKWSHHNSYSTPQYLYDALNVEFGFNLDPCPLSPNAILNGLEISWDNQRVFVNPPWSDVMPWVRKALDSKAEIVVFVLPARTDTPWFHTLKDNGAEIRLFRKRVHFLKDGVGGNKMPTDGTMVAIVKPISRAAHASEPTNQLAAKAASSMVAAGYVKREHEQAISERIQAAIEKATETLYKLLDEQGARNWGISRAAHAREPSDQIAAAAERLRYECETTEDPNSGFAKDIMTLVEFAESRAAHASEEGVYPMP